METRRLNPREMRDMRVQEAVARAMTGLISWKDVEGILCCSARHVRRIRAKCVLEGIEGLRDKRAGRRMPQRISDATIREIMQLREARYFDFNIQHFSEKLREGHGISVSYSYVKRLLQTTGLAEKAEARGKHRRKRQRRPLKGMMMHMDGSRHAWLGPESGGRDLIYMLDDATGEALYGEFVPEEDTRSCLVALRFVLETQGLFSELYTDRGSHFGRTPKAGGPIEEGNVQFARVLRGLRIRPIYARSPQARGRSERAFRTVQGRLPQELREAGITTWEGANRYLRTRFIPDFNSKFAISALEPGTAFMPLVGIDIDRACALEHEVSVYADNTVRWRRREFQIPPHPSRPSFAKCRALLVEYLDGRVDIEYGPLTVASFDKHGVAVAPRAQTAFA